ncbi:MAG: HlyD family efflux transporter periplasmic adaptor subunit [Burkholderiales bacterium]|nr:HlyD family efflux transporter periplasmic adaptor subunit [Burkholderiales bacterium]MDR4517413.1 HlyD family efflux transporter periplasmic adaptor subunit [Nitrosomonas sp.]
MSKLFRQEVLDAQSQRLVGSISLAQPLSIKTTVTIIVVIVATIMIFLFTSHYARKETVQGFLRPDKGIIKSYANRTGTVKEIYVKEGDRVKTGMPLISIITRQNMTSGEDLSERLISELTKQIRLLEDEANQNQRLEEQELSRINQRHAVLAHSRTVTLNQKMLLQERLRLLTQRRDQHEKLYQEGFISELGFQQEKENYLTVRQEVESLEQTLLQQQDELQQLEHDKKNIPEQYQLKILEIERRKSDINNQLSETKTNYNYVIRATHDGMVTAIQVAKGETLNPTRPLLTLLPEGAELVAELLLPTRSAGFVQSGDIARLRFEAFPHQRFGFLESRITRIDKALITQGEADLPINLDEPVYRLQAKLDQQVIRGYGKEFNLKSGMLFDADIILDRRSLIEWILDPIYSLGGRIS